MSETSEGTITAIVLAIVLFLTKQKQKTGTPLCSLKKPESVNAAAIVGGTEQATIVED
ncbi:hypothetical protein M378DRAFT_13188 [Amanita muscaria Koide BX008]|uniref:Uncharacterized protein n=1 Tax=Amanita muscaria (strain Koide BX008) TaxID=946122 RepID=A0A0C2WKC0_AMAMK|nr:hypothetical protein M378DRAFT_13188 [Amanita muscaria Koide BX008]